MRFTGWILTTALVVPLTAIGQDAMQHNTTGSQGSNISLEGEHFLTVLANEDASEIDLANLALKKSNNPQVKQYAKSKILAADPGMEQEAKNLQKQNNAPPSGDPNPSEKAEYYFLSKLSGKDFDKAYMNYEDGKQRDDLITVQHEAQDAKNPDIKKFAEKETAPVREAADAATKIAQNLGS